MNLQEVQQEINKLQDFEIEKLNDKFNSFSELYQFRKVYNAALFNEWAQDEGYSYEVENLGNGVIKLKEEPKVYKGKYNVHKSWRHHDGELCFGGDWFIVVAILPTGQISNHYHKDDWDLFRIPEVEKAKYPFDGHTGKDVLERLKNLT